MLKTENYKGYKVYFKRHEDGATVMASAGDINKYDGKSLFYAEAKNKGDVFKLIKRTIDMYSDIDKYIELTFKPREDFYGHTSRGVLTEYDPRTQVGRFSSKRTIQGKLQPVSYTGRMKRVSHRSYEVM